MTKRTTVVVIGSLRVNAYLVHTSYNEEQEAYNKILIYIDIGMDSPEQTVQTHIWERTKAASNWGQHCLSYIQKVNPLNSADQHRYLSKQCRSRWDSS